MVQQTCKRIRYAGTNLGGKGPCGRKATHVTEEGEFICRFHAGQNGRRKHNRHRLTEVAS
jgi:hypothetical protein